MKRFDKNDIVVINKAGDKNNNKRGIITGISEMIHVPVTIYYVKFEDNTKGYYFFGDLCYE